MISKKTKAPDILITGAGPTGLLMACQLARLGIHFRIVEKNTGPTTQSRALAIHAASMEIFSQMGIADNFVKSGKQVKAVNYFVKGRVEQRIALSDFGKGLTHFPFLLMLEQSRTERLLIDFLETHGCKVEWQTELVGFTQDDSGVQVTVRSSGVEETINTKWLVGADGAKSQVRRILDIPFGGETYPIDLFVLDCKVNWKLKEDEMYIAFSDHSFAGFFPMPGGRCRVIGFVPEDVPDRENVSFEDVNKDFADRMQMKIQLYDPSWISMYHSHHRYVSQFRTGRCFLAGDAAHIHSPVGAQGMNTGLQDAFNLAWKLALVCRKKANEKLLSSYQDERLPFARRLVRSTDRAFSVTVSQNPLLKYLRMYVAPRILAILLKIKLVEGILFKSISQIGIAYPDSILSRNTSQGVFPSVAPKPGERLPYILFEDAEGNSVNIQQRVNGLSLHLFVFSGSSKEVPEALAISLKKYSEVPVTFEIIPFALGTKRLYNQMGIKKTGLYLVRPDLYIGCRSVGLDFVKLKTYLESFLTS